MTDTQSTLKAMLESSNRLDTSADPPSPISEIDPHSLDEFFARLDKEMSLGNVPKPEDREAIISYYRSRRVIFLEDERAQALKPVRQSKPTSVKEEVKKFSLLGSAKKRIE